MEIKIYIDLLFFTNFYFDAFLLWLTCLLTRQRPKISRLLLAAGFGGLYSILLFFAPKSLLFTVSGKLVSGALMLFICSPPHCLRAFIKHLAVFYTLSLTAGGIVSALLFESGSFLGGAEHNGIHYIHLPFFSLPPLLIFGYLILRKAMQFGRTSGSESIYTIEVHSSGNRITMQGFYDSGNLLKTPEGLGVLVTDAATLSPLLQNLSIDDLPLKIPCKTLQGKGILPAFVPETMYIKKGLAKRQIKPFCIAVSPVPIHQHWNAILPRDFKESLNYETPVFTENI